ncbi:MAG: 4'-phosphopantetheinyl transferase superfamily protein [Bacteroidia bacterium]|nr:4'-phosphopantetheinyl transferase superfamily protein [Bacteroidia bacterium]
MLIKDEYINDIHFIVWKMEESALNVRDQEKQLGEKLIELLCNEDIIIDHLPSGKPFVKNKQCEISISHTKNYITAAIHDNNPIGIDIEYKGERVLRIQERFMSESEIDAARSTNQFTECDYTLLCWCAKEAMYKKAGLSGIDFKKDFYVHNAENGNVRVLVHKDSINKDFVFHYEHTDEFFVVVG